MLLDVVACCCAKFETAILTYHILFLKCRKYLFPSNLLRKIIFFLHVITSNVTLICYRIDLKCYNFSEEFCDKNKYNQVQIVAKCTVVIYDHLDRLIAERDGSIVGQIFLLFSLKERCRKSAIITEWSSLFIFF